MKVVKQSDSFQFFVEGNCLVTAEEYGKNKNLNGVIAKHYNIDLSARKGQQRLGFDSPGADPGKQNTNSVIPSPEDFFLFPFRLISATNVGKGTYKSTDFSDEKVLKASIPLLSYKPAYTNHDLYVGCDIGTIGKCEWVPATGKPGTKDYVPAGIDGPYVIDSKLYFDICRKMMSPVSSIQSSSVTIQFAWEASHDFESEWDFYDHLGQEVNGEEVRRIVTKIHNYIESSLVYEGADAYAKMKGPDGKYINIRPQSFSAANDRKLTKAEFEALQGGTAEEELKKIYFEKELLYGQVSFSAAANYYKPYLQKQTNEDDTMKTYLAKLLGCTEEEVTEEKLNSFKFLPQEEHVQLSEASKKVTDLSAELAEKETEITTLSNSVKDLEGKISGLELSAKAGEEHIAHLREEVTKAYKQMTVGKRVDDVILKEIEATTSIKSLHSKFELYTGKAYEEFGAHCGKCGSGDIKLRQSESDGNQLTAIENSHLGDLL